MADTTALVKIDDERIGNALTKPELMDQLLAEVKKHCDAFDGDVSTPAHRKQMSSFAYKVTRTKTAVDKYGKDMVAEAKAQIKVVDNARKLARDTLEEYKDEVRKPLTDWEAEWEKAKGRIENIKLAGAQVCEVAEEYLNIHTQLKAVDIATFPEDLRDEAAVAVDASILATTKSHENALKAEAEKEELERLRTAEQDRIAKEEQQRIEAAAADKAKAEAEAKAEQARIEAEQKAAQAIADANARAELASQQKIIAEHQAAEAVRVAQEQSARDKASSDRLVEQAVADEKAAAALEAEQIAATEAKRAANKAHQKKIMNAAYADMLHAHTEMTHESSIAVVKAIADGKISHVEMKF